jgi:hypothetical protein
VPKRNSRRNGSEAEGGALLLLGCSATKRATDRPLPALQLYDGVNFRVLRRFLNKFGWPAGLLIKIVSAKHGLMDATSMVAPYDQKMTRVRAEELRDAIVAGLRRVGTPARVFINLGQDYLAAISGIESAWLTARIETATGGIGKKMRAMKRWMSRLPRGTALLRGPARTRRSYLYFFPDWDDFVWEPFAPEADGEQRNEGDKSVERVRRYAHEIFEKEAPYDGVLVSLAQLYLGKGPLSRVGDKQSGTFDIRSQMRLPKRLLLFGDCGAFSYVTESWPPFSPAEAAARYEQCGVDVGASVDHIPVDEVIAHDENGRMVRSKVSESIRRRRMQLTTENAYEFLGVCRQRDYSFVPLGVIQGLSTNSYVRSVHDYLDMGYEHIGLGGLVPRSDRDILEIVAAVRRAIQNRTRGCDRNVWLHLFGILRPKLQPSFRDLGVSSFDSASYFRKAWLRSDQNYLAADGRRWYGTIRVPISNSKSMQAAARRHGLTPTDLAQREALCLAAIREYDGSGSSTRRLLERIDDYGPLLQRKGEDNHFVEKHQLLLRDEPWEACPCPMCRSAGIDVVVFRGASRNKRRGLHNTWVFFRQLRRWRTNAGAQNEPDPTPGPG